MVCFYYRLAKFVDKFGARPSGTEVLEKSIDYMIDLTKKEGINDIITEEVKVSFNEICFYYIINRNIFFCISNTIIKVTLISIR